ncbi:undecaprenyl-phosphate galactose phosphotransferase WbaP [Thermithiobacillus plumbiphilus]|uniref:Undecaprenyl-phosphate galactose phosphotransferase WbaP n=1 Tax=Thermithiobacillus plumbiphilus TaxID=1729899 RepID=A0ABU9D623_9PROT
MSNIAVSRQPTFRTFMLSTHAAKVLLLLGDLFALSLAFFLGRMGYWVWNGTSFMELSTAFVEWWGNKGELRSLLFVLLSGIAIAWFLAFGHYSQRRPFWDELQQILKVIVTLAIIDAALGFVGKWEFSRAWMISTWLLALLLIPLIRVQIKKALIRLGGWVRPTVVIGAGQNARDAAAALWSEPLLGFDVIGFLAVAPKPGENANALPEYMEVNGHRIPVIILGDDPELTLERLGNPHVVVALNFRASYENQELLQRLSLRHHDINIVPPISGLPLMGMEVTHFFRHEVLLLRVRNNLSRSGAQFLKRSFDVITSGLLLLLLSPVIGFIIWQIRREDAGPAFLRQERVGRNGQLFKCLKFRSMVENADEVLAQWLQERPEIREEYSRNFKLKNDPRVTRVGKWIRATSLDELPQLWNVFIGEMSLVGPRPLLARELPDYGDSINMYKEARPGITGVWQVSGRSETTFTDRINLDAWYVKNWCLWYDIVVLLKTVQVVLARKGAY